VSVISLSYISSFATYIELDIEAWSIFTRGEVGLNPTSECWTDINVSAKTYHVTFLHLRFIIQKNASVLDTRALRHLDRRQSIDGALLDGRHIRPEVPRTDTNLLGKVVDTKDGTTLVGTDNNESLGDAWSWIGDKLRLKGLPLSL
jgi:hypothetical protein